MSYRYTVYLFAKTATANYCWQLAVAALVFFQLPFRIRRSILLSISIDKTLSFSPSIYGAVSHYRYGHFFFCFTFPCLVRRLNNFNKWIAECAHKPMTEPEFLVDGNANLVLETKIITRMRDPMGETKKDDTSFFFLQFFLVHVCSDFDR